MVFPTRDETVAALARNRARLERTLRVPTPGWDVIRWSWDKRHTYRLADALGIPVPRTWYPGGPDGVDGIDGRPPPHRI